MACEDASPESGDADTDGNRLETLKRARIDAWCQTLYLAIRLYSCIWQLGPPKWGSTQIWYIRVNCSALR
eukprot:4062917-Prymnesium_polylepis.1